MNFLSCAGELNHHGKYMCDSMYKLLGEQYRRISTSMVDETRKSLGYRDLDAPYHIDGSDFSLSQVREQISWADVIDYGAAPEVYLHEAVAQNKIVFIRIERLLKEGVWKLLAPQVFTRYYRKYTQYRNNKNVYYLCINPYAADDLRLIGVRNERVLQWAYCPQFIDYDDPVHAAYHTGDTLRILWCGRLISWKHPEIAVRVAAELLKRKIPFHMEIVGGGPLEAKLKKLIQNQHLENHVIMDGIVPAPEIREKMRSFHMFLATSDHNEGWGVVINEAMNSGCAVIACEEMGAAPVLIHDGENGILFSRHKLGKVPDTIFDLLHDPDRLNAMRCSSYVSLRQDYHPDVYANTFVKLAEHAMNGKSVSGGKLGALLASPHS